jgi:hypothetical protein
VLLFSVNFVLLFPPLLDHADEIDIAWVSSRQQLGLFGFARRLLLFGLLSTLIALFFHALDPQTRLVVFGRLMTRHGLAAVCRGSQFGGGALSSGRRCHLLLISV